MISDINPPGDDASMSALRQRAAELSDGTALLQLDDHQLMALLAAAGPGGEAPAPYLFTGGVYSVSYINQQLRRVAPTDWVQKGPFRPLVRRFQPLVAIFNRAQAVDS